MPDFPLWRPPSKEEKRENNSVHSLLVHVFTQPGSKADHSPRRIDARSTPKNGRRQPDRRCPKVSLTEAVRHHSITVLARAITVTDGSLISASRRSSIASTTRREKGPRCAYAAIRATAIRAEDGSLLAQFRKVLENGSRVSGIAVTTWRTVSNALTLLLRSPACRSRRWVERSSIAIRPSMRLA